MFVSTVIYLSVYFIFPSTVSVRLSQATAEAPVSSMTPPPIRRMWVDPAYSAPYFSFTVSLIHLVCTNLRILPRF